MRSSPSSESLTAHIEQLTLQDGVAARLEQLQQIKIMLTMQEIPQGGVSVDDVRALFGSLESQNSSVEAFLNKKIKKINNAANYIFLQFSIENCIYFIPIFIIA